MGTIVGTDNAAGNVATLTVTWPSTDAGDIAVLFWSHSSTATRTTTPSAAGFSNPLSDRTDGSEVLSYWEQTCDGTESGDFSVSMSGGTRQVLNLMVIRGYLARDVAASNADAGTDANHTAPSVTPTASTGCTIVASGERATSGSTSATPATNYTVATQNSAVGTGGNYSQISYLGSGGTLTDDGVAGTQISPGTWVHNVSASDVSMFTLYFAPIVPAPVITSQHINRASRW